MMRCAALCASLLLGGCDDGIESLVMTTIDVAYKCQREHKTAPECKESVRKTIHEEQPK